MKIVSRHNLQARLLPIANLIGVVVEFVISRPLLLVAIRLGAAQSRRRNRKGQLRMLWGVTPILTLPLKLRCDKALGFQSESLVLTNYYITNDFTWNLKWSRFLIPNSKLQAAFFKLILCLILLRYDVLHYFADRGVLPPEEGLFGINADELRALRQAGKIVYVFTYGADVRTRRATLALGKWNFCRDCDDPGRYCICDDDKAVPIMARTSSLITAFVALGDMLEYVPAPCHFAYWPVDTEKNMPISKRREDGVLRLFHAPNHTHFKGTMYLHRAVNDLRQRGHELDLLEISGVSNPEVIGSMAEVDVVVDQLVGGSYGYTALEAMARGKPVITYVRDSRLIVGFENCPLLNATPDTIEEVLLWCLENRNQLARIGRQSRSYVERYHSISAVAARFARLYQQTMPLTSPVAERLAAFERREAERADLIPSVDSWEHRWRPPSVH